MSKSSQDRRRHPGSTKPAIFRQPAVGRRAALAMLGAIVAAGCGGRDARPALGLVANSALGRPVELQGGSGDSAVVTDGRLAREGGPPGDQAVTLGSVRSAVLIDLGTAQPVGSLRLQANAEDVYFVEASSDSTTWTVLWRVPPLEGFPGLRTRTTNLPRPAKARWILVRATTSRAPAVSELQAFPTASNAWPPLDSSLPDTRLPLWPWLTRTRAAALFGALASLMMAAAGWSVLAGRMSPGPRRGALLVLAAASLVAWPNFLNFHYFAFIHTWEFAHYYLGGKYLPELGYTRLYACAAAVDAEDGATPGSGLVRDLRDNQLLPAEALRERSAECRAAFSPARWQSFRRDAHFFRAAMGPKRWVAIRGDHGFNGTPAWAVLAGLLGGLAPASWTQITLLAMLDVGLMLAVFFIMGRTFGIEAACIAAGYWGVNTLAPFGWTGGGFLRHDWLFWLVGGIAAMRAERLGLAGFALAYAALLRIFPSCALAALALKVGSDVVSARSARPLLRYGRFAKGAAVAVILFSGAPMLFTGRVGIWREFADNSAKHLRAEAANFIGLGVFLAYEDDSRVDVMADRLQPDPHAAWKARQSAAEQQNRPARWAAAAGFLLLLGLALRRTPDWVALILGIGLMPELFKLSGYYYSAFLVYAALWNVLPAAGLALSLFAWISTVAPGLWPGGDGQSAWLSLAAVLLATGLTAAFAWGHGSIPHDPANTGGTKGQGAPGTAPSDPTPGQRVA